MDQERWEKFSKHDQLGHISSELLRANYFENDNKELYQGCLERAINLVLGIIKDPKWKDMRYNFLFLHSELAKLYIGESTGVLRLYNCL